MVNLMTHIANEELKALEMEREFLKNMLSFSTDEQRIDILEKIEVLDADIVIIRRNLIMYRHMVEIGA